ncbi:MAG: glycosyltransferase [Clostridiales bacterium]|nr:glycosyltransferase [Clostridiales bacterium]
MNFKKFIKRFVPVPYSKYQKTKKDFKNQLKNQKTLIDEQQNMINKQQKEISKLSVKLSELENTITKNQRFINHVDFLMKMEKHDYYKALPKKLYVQEVSDWFHHVTKENMDLVNPKTYNQKIQWLKIYDSTPLKTKLTDKYAVREWVKEKIGEKYLTRLYGVWDDFDDIDFSKLPDKFVLKANHGCGYNYIVRGKNNFNQSDARYKFKTWTNISFAYRGLEPQYENIPVKIIAEEYLENSNNDLYDYKFWCFNGEPKYIQFLSDRNKGGLKMAFFDTEWNKMPFVYDHKRMDHDIEKPENLDEMLDVAKKLCKGFAHVRVDLYHLNNNIIKFGEMTFTSANGACHWDPPEYNLILGNLMTLPEKYSG